MSELEMIRMFSTLPIDVQRAASRLAGDMAELTGNDDTHAVMLVATTEGAFDAC